MFENLGAKELEQIFNLSVESEKVKRIINEEKDEEGVRVLQDHAFGEYWNRRLKKAKTLSDKEISYIFNHLHFPTAEGILGEAAKMGLVNIKQCADLLEKIKKNGWAFRAIQSRILLDEIIGEKLNSQKKEKILDKFIDFRMTWAIIEAIPVLENEELKKLEKKMENSSILNRGNRHLIREKIKEIIKRKK